MIDIQDAVAVLAGVHRLAVLTGAGISKESGIPTFREAQTGLWAQFDPAELATREAFRANPDRVWSWYMSRARRVAAASPNAGHRALVKLEDLIAEVIILTQNVDGLHTRAGSSRVTELHGRVDRYKCFENYRGDPTLIDLAAISHDSEHAPHCPGCRAKVRPDVVWFGERLPRHAVDAAHSAVAACDAMLVVGTSGLVQPAASLPIEARRHGAPVIDVNPEPDALARYADVYLAGAAGQILPQLVNQLENHAHRR